MTTNSTTNMKAGDRIRLLRYVDHYVKNAPNCQPTMVTADIALMAVLNCPRLKAYQISTLEIEIANILKRWIDIDISMSVDSFRKQDWCVDELTLLESNKRLYGDRSLFDQAAILSYRLKEAGFDRTVAACQHKIKRSM